MPLLWRLRRDRTWHDAVVGALGMKAVPAAYFGIVERFSVFAATGFNAALGIHLFCMKTKDAPASKMSAEQEAKNQ